MKQIVNYEAPEVVVLELFSEGVVCASGRGESAQRVSGYTWDDDDD